MQENLLLHILTGEASLEEKEEFYHWLENNKEEQEHFFDLKSVWLYSSMQNEAVDVDSEFNALWHKMEHQRRISSEKQQIGRRGFFRYAAIILLVLGVGGVMGYFFAQNKIVYHDAGTQKYTAMRGSVSIVEFADGTRVWLNSESKVTFHEDVKNKQRFAELTGEAYFEVAHRDDCPLVVKIGDLVVRDLGTTFNVKAYPGDKYIETSLVEGKADILTNTGKPIVALHPGESAMYYKAEKRMEIRKITENVLSAWREGKFVIRDQKLEDIFTELSRWYGVEFLFENSKLRDYRFTGNIKKSTTALHVLKVLRATTDFNYRIIESVDKPDVIIIY